MLRNIPSHFLLLKTNKQINKLGNHCKLRKRDLLVTLMMLYLHFIFVGAHSKLGIHPMILSLVDTLENK